MTDSTRRPVVLFDGVCNLCNGAVQFIIRRDPSERFHFASLQSAVASQLIARDGPIQPLPDSLVLLDEEGLHVRSTAVLRIARHLSFPWRLTALFLFVPRPIRDWAYDLVARRRYRWFGRQDVCLAPTAEMQARLLHEDVSVRRSG